MKWLRRQKWLVVFLVCVIVISGTGSDVARFRYLHCDRQPSASAVLIGHTEKQQAQMDLCSADQLGVQMMQQKRGEMRTVVLRIERQPLFQALLPGLEALSERRFFQGISELAFCQSTTYQLSVFINYIHDKDGDKGSCIL